MLTAASFHFWIRRTDEPAGPFSLRFRVKGGKGLLRVAHADVLMDPPAASTATEQGLTAEAVRASRFLLVAEGGRLRKGFFLAALQDAFLNGLPEGAWVELTPRVAGDMRLLVPRTLLPRSHDDLRLPTVTEEDDLVTNPRGRPRSEMSRMRQVLAEAGSASSPSPPRAAPVLRERSWRTGVPTPAVEEKTDPSIGLDPVFIGGGTEDEARALVGNRLLASASMFDAPAPGTLDDQGAPAGALASPSAARPFEHPRPRIQIEDLAVGPQRTALVRHLRRSSQRDRSQLDRLKARVEELEAQLARARQELSEKDD